MAGNSDSSDAPKPYHCPTCGESRRYKTVSSALTHVRRRHKRFLTRLRRQIEDQVVAVAPSANSSQPSATADSSHGGLVGDQEVTAIADEDAPAIEEPQDVEMGETVVDDDGAPADEAATILDPVAASPVTYEKPAIPDPAPVLTYLGTNGALELHRALMEEQHPEDDVGDLMDVGDAFDLAMDHQLYEE